MTESTPPHLPAPLAHLLNPAAYPHPVDAVRCIETHVSWLLLAGDYAYKIKKPVDLGFLDFRRLERRHFYCQEEIRLNRRLAPEIYLDVVPLFAGPDGACFQGEGEILEWAVRMRAFPPHATLDRAPRLLPAQIDTIAARIADFHASLPPLPPDSPYGAPETVLRPAQENFAQINLLMPPGHPALPCLDRLSAWTAAESERLLPFLQARKDTGAIREGHGDLHLGNIAWVNDTPLIFDALEFDPALRFIDPINEIAFLAMDLMARGEAGLAWRFLDRYLSRSGDYAGFAGFTFYAVYRAMVRAKIAAIRAAQTAETLETGEFARHLALAERLAAPCRPALLLMHGPSGSGKSWLAKRLVELLGGIRLCSDIERKRLFGLAANARPTPEQSARLYSAEATAATFAHLERLAISLLTAGHTVIVDATFLDPALRARFIALAARHGLTAELIVVSARAETLRQRIKQRRGQTNEPSDADLAVLERQLAHYRPPEATEGARIHPFDSESAASLAALRARLAAYGVPSKH